MIRITLMAAAVCSLVAAVDAQAADVAANKNTKSVLKLGPSGLSGQYEIIGDADWHKFNIVKGDHYAVVLEPGYDGRYKNVLLDNTGKTLVTTYGYGRSDPAGFEFTAGATALRFIGVKLELLEDGGILPIGYRLVATKECANSLKTKCTTSVNQPISSTLAWDSDRDWWKVSVERGRRYNVVFDAAAGDEYLYVRTNTGSQQVSGYGDDYYRRPATASFTAAYSGVYFIEAAGYGPGARTYSLSVTPQ